VQITKLFSDSHFLIFTYLLICIFAHQKQKPYFCGVNTGVIKHTSPSGFHGAAQQANRHFNHSVFLER
jgi:hypothetical protein